MKSQPELLKSGAFAMRLLKNETKLLIPVYNTHFPCVGNEINFPYI